jgi:hypothetical protein
MGLLLCSLFVQASVRRGANLVVTPSTSASRAAAVTVSSVDWRTNSVKLPLPSVALEFQSQIIARF